MTITTSPMHDRGPGWRCSGGLGVRGGGFCAAGTWCARQRAPAMCRTTPRPPGAPEHADKRKRALPPPHAATYPRATVRAAGGAHAAGGVRERLCHAPRPIYAPKTAGHVLYYPYGRLGRHWQGRGRCLQHTAPPAPSRPCARLAALMQLGVCGSGPDTSWGKFGQNPSPDSGSTPPSYP